MASYFSFDSIFYVSSQGTRSIYPQQRCRASWSDKSTHMEFMRQYIHHRLIGWEWTFPGELDRLDVRCGTVSDGAVRWPVRARQRERGGGTIGTVAEGRGPSIDAPGLQGLIKRRCQWGTGDVSRDPAFRWLPQNRHRSLCKAVSDASGGGAGATCGLSTGFLSRDPFIELTQPRQKEMKAAPLRSTK